MNNNCLFSISYSLFTIILIIVIYMFIVSVKEKNKIIRNREKGIFDQFFIIQRVEDVIKKINNKKINNEEKQNWYKFINDCLKDIESEL